MVFSTFSSQRYYRFIYNTKKFKVFLIFLIIIKKVHKNYLEISQFYFKNNMWSSYNKIVLVLMIQML